jgi:putative ABC transport system permease protein
MNITSTIKLAGQNMISNKMRTGLSSLGIIIGVFSVVVLLAVGQWATSSIVSQVSSLGTNLLTVRPWAANSGDVRRQTGSNQKIFTMDHVDMISQVENVIAVAPLVSSSKQVIYGSNNSTISINGVTPSYETVNNTPVTAGTFITEAQNTNRDKVAVIGSTVVSNLFGTEDPIGKTIRIGNTLFQVTGIAKSKWSSMGNNQDNVIYIPLSTAQISILGSRYLSTIAVMINTEDNMSTAKDAITTKLLETFKITDPDKATFTVSSQAEILDTLSSVTGTLKMFLWGIAAISLVVGGIGVMNILLVTVSERTKEIGIRKAIGAKSRDIIEQFLVESVMLTCFWWIIGILLSYGIVAIVNAFVPTLSATITSGQILLALGFSVGTGLFFWIFPAYKAAKMKPIDALRSE